MDGRRIRKEKVADSKISGYVWTGPYLTIVITILSIVNELTQNTVLKFLSFIISS